MFSSLLFLSLFLSFPNPREWRTDIEAAGLIDLICTPLFFLFFSILSTWIQWRVVCVVCSPTSFFDSSFAIVEKGTTRIKSWGWVGFACALRREEDPFRFYQYLRLQKQLPAPKSARLFVLLVKMLIHLRRDNTHLTYGKCQILGTSGSWLANQRAPDPVEGKVCTYLT